MITDVMYNVNMEWDLAGTLYGTRGVYSFGEGLVKCVGRVFDIWRMVFKVGLVKSWSVYTDGDLQSFSFYWFGNLPRRMSALPQICENVARNLATFFRDKAIENPYRIFVRRVKPARGFGGTGGICSFVLEYDEDIGLLEEDDIFYLVFHEMIHGWPLMQSQMGNDLDLTAWYNEGISHFSALVGNADCPYQVSLIITHLFCLIASDSSLRPSISDVSTTN